MAAGEQVQRGETQRSYFVRTYGCQMNVHDSERIAGLLEADDLVAAPTMADADIIVLNTCCIRENADNKLYGQLGNLKRLKEERPEVQIAVAGCLAQKDQDLVRERAPHVDVVFGTHNVSRAAELLADARASGPVTEILAESEEFPSALRFAVKPNTQRGSRSRSAATTRAPSALCRRFGAARFPGRSASSSTKCAGWRPMASAR